MIDVSIIIVSYNTKKLTLDCLHSIYEKTRDVSFDVTVVDNNSKDGSVEVIQETFPMVKLIKSNENLGFAKANNLAIKSTNSKFVFFLNPDTILKNNAVKILNDFMCDNKYAGVSGAMLYDGEGSRTFSFGKLPLLKDKILLTFLPHCFFGKERRGKIELDKVTESQEVGFICGADLMVRRELLDSIGYFDEDFFLYYEETELQFRIRKTGAKIYIVPQAEIIHLEGKSLNKKSRREQSYISEYLYYKKCYKLTKFSLFKIVFFINLFLRFFSKPQMMFRVLKYILGN